MLPRKSMQEKFSGSTVKQRVTVIALVIIILIVIWQMIGLFSGGKTTPEPIAVNQKNMTAKPSMQASAAGPSAAGSNGGGAMMPQPLEQFQPRQAPVQNDAALLKLQQETQAKYIAALNELQMLKYSVILQRLIKRLQPQN